MKMLCTDLLWLIVLIEVSLTVGCMSVGKNTLPSGDLTMTQIYRQVTQEQSTDNDAKRQVNPIRRKVLLNHHDGSKMLSSNEHLFMSLPNPEIAIFVYPHWVNEDGESFPVPGYGSAFFLYKSNHFALS